MSKVPTKFGPLVLVLLASFLATAHTDDVTTEQKKDRCPLLRMQIWSVSSDELKDEPGSEKGCKRKVYMQSTRNCDEKGLYSGIDHAAGPVV